MCLNSIKSQPNADKATMSQNCVPVKPLALPIINNAVPITKPPSVTSHPVPRILCHPAQPYPRNHERRRQRKAERCTEFPISHRRWNRAHPKSATAVQIKIPIQGQTALQAGGAFEPCPASRDRPEHRGKNQHQHNLNQQCQLGQGRVGTRRAGRAKSKRGLRRARCANSER